MIPQEIIRKKRDKHSLTEEEIQIFVAREMTKIHETFYRGTALEVKEQLDSSEFGNKGEFVLVIEGRLENKKMDIKPETIELLTYLSKKISLTESVKIVHKLTGLSKNNLYSEALLEKKKYE